MARSAARNGWHGCAHEKRADRAAQSCATGSRLLGEGVPGRSGGHGPDLAVLAALCLELGPGVLERQGAVEDGVAWR